MRIDEALGPMCSGLQAGARWATTLAVADELEMARRALAPRAPRTLDVRVPARRAGRGRRGDEVVLFDLEEWPTLGSALLEAGVGEIDGRTAVLDPHGDPAAWGFVTAVLDATTSQEGDRAA